MVCSIGERIIIRVVMPPSLCTGIDLLLLLLHVFVSVAASILIDVAFWCVLVPVLSAKEFHLTMVSDLKDYVKECLEEIEAGKVEGQEDIDALKRRKYIIPQIWKDYSVRKGAKYAPKRKKDATDLTRENLQRSMSSGALNWIRPDFLVVWELKRCD